jgi:hypothetical protein
MRAICAARSIDYLHVLQPTLHDEGAKPPTSEELKKGAISKTWLAGVREGYPRLRDAGTELRAAGIAFLDASRIFRDVRETLYYDACHFSRRGCEILCDAVVAALLDEIPAR